MDVLAGLVRALHILGAIVWFGGALAMNLVVVPGIFSQPLEARRAVGRALTLGFERLAIPAAVVTAVTGFLLGSVYGPLHQPADLSTSFGLVWLASIVIVVAVLGTGALVSSPALRRLFGDDALWIPAPDGRASPVLCTAMRAVQRGLGAELGGLVLTFVLMEYLRVVG
jgi:uncharacterized membrane protein